MGPLYPRTGPLMTLFWVKGATYYFGVHLNVVQDISRYARITKLDFFFSQKRKAQHSKSDLIRQSI